jgi:hypothetical protein
VSPDRFAGGGRRAGFREDLLSEVTFPFNFPLPGSGPMAPCAAIQVRASAPCPPCLRGRGSQWFLFIFQRLWRSPSATDRQPVVTVSAVPLPREVAREVIVWRCGGASCLLDGCTGMHHVARRVRLAVAAAR